MLAKEVPRGNTPDFAAWVRDRFWRNFFLDILLFPRALHRKATATKV